MRIIYQFISAVVLYLLRIYGVVLKLQGYSRLFRMLILNLRGYMYCLMDGSSFTILDETPCADPHAGCCGG